MAVTQIQKWGNSSTGTTASKSSTGATLIIVYAAGDSNLGISDNKSNTWTLIANPGGTGNGAGAMYYCINPTVGAGHTFSMNIGYGSISAEAWVGDITPVYDQHNSTNQATGQSSIQSGSITPTVNGELIIMGITNGGTTSTVSVDSGMNLDEDIPGVVGTSYGSGMASKVQSTAAAINPTWTIGTGGTFSISSAVIASFKMSATAVNSNFLSFF